MYIERHDEFHNSRIRSVDKQETDQVSFEIRRHQRMKIILAEIQLI